MLCSINKCKADKETEQYLRVFEASNKQLVQRVLKQLLVHFLAVREHICVDLDLNCKDLYLVCGYFKLVGLAVELKAVNRLKTEVSLA